MSYKSGNDKLINRYLSKNNIDFMEKQKSEVKSEFENKIYKTKNFQTLKKSKKLAVSKKLFLTDNSNAIFINKELIRKIKNFGKTAKIDDGQNGLRNFNKLRSAWTGRLYISDELSSSFSMPSKIIENNKMGKNKKISYVEFINDFLTNYQKSVNYKSVHLKKTNDSRSRFCIDGICTKTFRKSRNFEIDKEFYSTDNKSLFEHSEKKWLTHIKEDYPNCISLKEMCEFLTNKSI
ncbi:hypothetical protein MHBO_000948 [Bonamia ostreae]|uniref:Uncharacterized protein n=1 Tax=Bonamia ostreae TaxID=126728 RepID=A0ABV2AI15_9EUKA